MFYRKVKAAHAKFSRKYLLHSLGPVLHEIYLAHEDNEVVYQFSDEAEKLIEKLESRVQFGMAETCSSMMPKDANYDSEDSDDIDDSDDEDDMEEEDDPIM